MDRNSSICRVLVMIISFYPEFIGTGLQAVERKFQPYLVAQRVQVLLFHQSGHTILSNKPDKVGMQPQVFREVHLYRHHPPTDRTAPAVGARI